MSTSPRTSPVLAVSLAATVVLSVAGCSPETEDLRESVSSVVEEEADRMAQEARTAAEEVVAGLDGLEGLDPQVRATVDDAVQSSTAAIDQATAALTDDLSETARLEAEAALADARAQLDEAAQTVDGAAAAGLDRLAQQLEEASAQLRTSEG